MPSFYESLLASEPPLACDCHTLAKTIGPPPLFNLTTPPPLPLALLADLGLANFKLACQSPANSSTQTPAIMTLTTSATSAATASVQESHPFLFMIIVFIVILILLLLFFIFVAMLFVRLARIKLLAANNTNAKEKASKDSRTASASNRSYLISNSGASNNSSSSLSGMSMGSASKKESMHTTNMTRQSRDQFMSHQQFYPEVLTSSSACNSAESSSASPKSSNLNSSYLTELDNQFQFIKPTGPALTALPNNKLVTSSTSSSFCDSQSFLISNASHSSSYPTHFMSHNINNNNKIISNSRDG